MCIRQIKTPELFNSCADSSFSHTIKQLLPSICRLVAVPIFYHQNPPFLTLHHQSFFRLHPKSKPIFSFIQEEETNPPDNTLEVAIFLSVFWLFLNYLMKRYRNRGIWEFEHEMNMFAAAYRNGDRNESEFLNCGVNGRKVVLGIDGGTASTVCICMPLIPFAQPLPDPLPVLARAVAGCSNHNSVGESSARETLEQVMADALARSASTRSAVQAVCLSVSGVNHPKDQHRILNWLREIFPSHVRLFVQNDAVAALASGTMGKLHGCVLIAGTGTIAYGFTEDGKEARAAGAGPVLGDWGSGYGIAAQALTAVIRAHDGRGPQTTLTQIILDTLNLSSPDELIGWTYVDPSWARVAALLPVVVSCADAGDPMAIKILFDAVNELASSVKAVVERLELCGEDGKDSFPLVMVGVVLEANERWDIGNEVISCISKDFPGVFPIRPKVEPAVGAALLAWNSLMRQCHQQVLER